MTLSPRLAAVLDLTPHVAVAADIGTDHGYLPVAWLQAGRAERAIASDLRAGPLAQAAKTVALAGLQDRIELRQGDGLTVLRPGEADVACIAGVGGTVVQHVLGAVSPPPVRQLLLQPMNGWAGVRRQAARIGLALRQEVLVAEGERLYLVLAVDCGPAQATERGRAHGAQHGAQRTTEPGAQQGADHRAAADATWAPPPGLTARGQAAVWEAGPLLFKRRDPLLAQWLEARRTELRRLLDQIEAGQSRAAAERRAAVADHLAGLEELRQCW